MGASCPAVRSSSSSIGCCDMSLKCWCRWRWHRCFLSATFLFFLSSFLILAFAASIFAWLTFSPYDRSDSLSPSGCREDSEGSWSVGIFYGDSPFTLEPIETRNVWRDESAAWPVSNPVLSCETVSAAGYPSNFVADPFLFEQDDILYVFFETKNSITLQGDIGVAKSFDKGATWQPLGIALDEEWHLSYPYVFRHLDQVYMMPESSQKGELRLYRALKFPLQWTLEKVILKKPLVDSFIIEFEGTYWLFGSDFSSFGSKKNGQMEIWYSDSPLGPWKPHKKNPVYNIDKSFGTRNGGRPFIYDGYLYRVGQDCGSTYGRRVRVFKVELLTKEEYKEVEVQLGMKESEKGLNAWNGARYHHLDVKQLSSGDWVAVMDGDRVPSGHSLHRFIIGFASFVVVATLVILVGVLVGAVQCVLPLNCCLRDSRKRSDATVTWECPLVLFSKSRRVFSRLNTFISPIRGSMKSCTYVGRLALALSFAIGLVFLCNGVRYIYGGNGAEEAYLWKGHYSQFTLLTMTYDARLWNLKMYVKHYSRCASVAEILVAWNKGQPPLPSDFDSAVPVRIRVEKQNSLNNRFRRDPSIKTRAVLELDDDIMMSCDDVEHGFKVWREHPERIVGFYPRLIDGIPLKYGDEKYARTHHGYNMILTGAAFVDSRLAFERYWSEDAKEGRKVVDKLFNCEDLLLNFLYANASSLQTVEYVKPVWAIDTSKLSGAAISRNTKLHHQIRTDCLAKFSEMYGTLLQKWKFSSRKDGWDA